MVASPGTLSSVMTSSTIAQAHLGGAKEEKRTCIDSPRVLRQTPSSRPSLRKELPYACRQAARLHTNAIQECSTNDLSVRREEGRAVDCRRLKPAGRMQLQRLVISVAVPARRPSLKPCPAPSCRGY